MRSSASVAYAKQIIAMVPKKPDVKQEVLGVVKVVIVQLSGLCRPSFTCQKLQTRAFDHADLFLDRLQATVGQRCEARFCCCFDHLYLQVETINCSSVDGLLVFDKDLHRLDLYSGLRKIFSIFLPFANSSISLSRYRIFCISGSSISSTRIPQTVPLINDAFGLNLGA